MSKPKIIFVVNGHEFTAAHRLPIIKGAKNNGYIVNAVAPMNSPAMKRLESDGITVYGINLSRRGLNVWDELLSIQELTCLYRQLSPDIVHHATIKPVIYGSIAARRAQVKAVVNAITGLGYIYTGVDLRTRFLRKIVNLLYRFAFYKPRQCVIFQNKDDQKLMGKLGLVQSNNSVLIPSSGVNLSYFTSHPEAVGPLKVMLPARMIWDKGVAQFVAAAQRLKRKNGDISFILVGGLDEGNPNAISKEELLAFVNDGVVEWWGHVNDMRTAYRAAHIVVLPSYYREGLPKVLLEAAATSRPVITTDAPGCRDALIDGETGYLVPVKDSVVLINKISSLLNDRKRRVTMGKAGRKLVEAKFSDKQIVRDTLKVYEDLL